MTDFEDFLTNQFIYPSEPFTTDMSDDSESSILPPPTWGTPETSSTFLQDLGLSSSTESTLNTAPTITTIAEPTDHDSLIRQEILEDSEEETIPSLVPNDDATTTTSTFQVSVAFHPEVDVMLGAKNRIISRNKQGAKYFLDQVAHHGDRILEMARPGYTLARIQIQKYMEKQIMEAVHSRGGQFLVRKNSGNGRSCFCADLHEVQLRTRNFLREYVGRACGDVRYVLRPVLPKNKDPRKTKIDTLLQQIASQQDASSSSHSPAAIASAAISFVRKNSPRIRAEKLKNATRTFILKHPSCAKLPPAQVGEILRQIDNASDHPSWLMPHLDMTP